MSTSSSLTKKPNVIVFFTDQQRWDTAGCYGNPMGLTPHLDAMARGGVLFEQAFTCQPVCAPARASLQTGMYATAAGVWRNGLALPANVTTLADCFNAAGYETGYIGKWHLANTNAKPVPTELRGRYRHWIASDVLEFTSHPNDGVIFDGQGRPVRLHGYRANVMTDMAVEFIRCQRQSPFFLMVSTVEPHFQNDMQRFVAPDGYADRYRDRCHVPADLRDRAGNWRQELPDYYGMCANLDENLGRLLTLLDSLSLRERTIVLFLSDHGCHFFTREREAPNSEYKRTCHEASIRIPLAMAGPGIPRGAKVVQPVSLVDVPATLLSAAGLPAAPQMQGRDMMPLAAGNCADWPQEVFVQISESHVGRAIRTDRWKYAVAAPGANGWQDSGSDVYIETELYDLHADPSERNNMVACRETGNVLRDLRARLISRMVAAGERLPEIRPSAPV